MHKNHFWMVAMCILPLLLIFLLPVFKINNPLAIFIIFLVMFAGHFFMMGRHGHGGHDGHDENDTEGENQNKKEENHAHHQH